MFKQLLAGLLVSVVAGVAVASDGEESVVFYEAVSRFETVKAIQAAARDRVPNLVRLWKVQGSKNYTGHGFDKGGKPSTVFVFVIPEDAS